jgi:VIT1/CCC1 family predicted Fe2+/Mn2+ transporter
MDETEKKSLTKAAEALLKTEAAKQLTAAKDERRRAVKAFWVSLIGAIVFLIAGAVIASIGTESGDAVVRWSVASALLAVAVFALFGVFVAWYKKKDAEKAIAQAEEILGEAGK